MLGRFDLFEDFIREEFQECPNSQLVSSPAA